MHALIDFLLVLAAFAIGTLFVSIIIGLAILAAHMKIAAKVFLLFYMCILFLAIALIGATLILSWPFTKTPWYPIPQLAFTLLCVLVGNIIGGQRVEKRISKMIRRFMDWWTRQPTWYAWIFIPVIVILGAIAWVKNNLEGNKQ